MSIVERRDGFEVIYLEDGKRCSEQKPTKEAAEAYAQELRDRWSAEAGGKKAGGDGLVSREKFQKELQEVFFSLGEAARDDKKPEVVSEMRQIYKLLYPSMTGDAVKSENQAAESGPIKPLSEMTPDEMRARIQVLKFRKSA